ncbi:MAG: hypothetical protein V5A57_02715 [Candidatus Paceibacterota bacterium]
MIIGFSSGDFHRIFSKKEDASLFENIDCWDYSLVNAIELNCARKEIIDYFLNHEINLSFLDYISVHGPNLSSLSSDKLKKTLLNLEEINKKYKIDNFIFHVNGEVNWQLIKDSITSPISVENMDNHKIGGRTVEQIRKIVNKYGFNVTLDLQHCYTNDKSMELADQFHNEFGDKIVEYHLSGFRSEFPHYPLFKTEQDKIIDSLSKDIPIIIESTFDQKKEIKKELDYILEKIKNN